MVIMEHQPSSTFTNEEIYKLFLYLQSLDDLKRALIMVLVHVAPKEVTTTQLTTLAGYSKSSKYIFKSKVLESLESEGIIQITKPYKRLMLIRLHPNNILLQKFSLLCQEEGKELSESFLKDILEST